MIAFRLLRVVLHLLQGLATCALVFPLVGEEMQSRLNRNWSRKLLSLCKVEASIAYADGAAMASRALIWAVPGEAVLPNSTVKGVGDPVALGSELSSSA